MSSEPPLSRLDLNLLVSLDALLTERSVTRAAEQLRLSQPALSAALARLRTHFDDQLLVRHGNTHELTPLAQLLLEPVAATVAAARRVFETTSAWEPATSERAFTVYAADYGFVTLGTRVSALAASLAPGVRFQFLQHTPSIVADPESHLRAADGMLLPHGYISGYPHLDLCDERWLVLAAAGAEHANAARTLASLTERPWVFTYLSQTTYPGASAQLEALGITLRVEAVVQSFLALPHFIAGTNRLGLIQSGLAPAVLAAGGLQALEPPFEATPQRIALWWHPSRTHDPAHRWMRERFAEAASAISP